MIRIAPGIACADLQETLNILVEAASEFKRTAAICAYCSGLPSIEALLTTDRLNQFYAMTRSITFPLKDFDYDVAVLCGLEDAIEEQARLMQCWITLGAIVESAMKIWLAIYYDDFSRSDWRKWTINESNVISGISDTIDTLVVEGELEKSQGQSLKATVQSALEKRRDVPDLDMFDFKEMLRFYRKKIKWETDTLEYINRIRTYRNCIHAFSPKQIGNWTELMDALHFTCALLFELTSCTPDCTDILIAAEAEVEMRTEYEVDM